jgi:hypothetical protein
VIGKRQIRKGLLLACSLVASPLLFAQEPAADDGDTVLAGAEQARERDTLEPRVASGTFTEEPPGRRQQSGGERVIDQLDLDRTEVTGNQELPKVLYIVPWQKSDPGDLVGRPVNSLLDEVLAPLDREEFIRQVDYYSDLYGVTGEEE